MVFWSVAYAVRSAAGWPCSSIWQSGLRKHFHSAKPMKTLRSSRSLFPFGSIFRTLGRRLTFGFPTLSSTLPMIGAGLMLLGVAGGEERVSAQIFPPRGDDTTPSMGVFRVIVVPAFTNLFAPAVGLNGYPGYHSADARLTSPVLIDNTTMIGRSDRHDRLLAGSVPVGLPIMDNLGYGDYVYKPAIFAYAPPPTEEILTQIRHLALSP